MAEKKNNPLFLAVSEEQRRFVVGYAPTKR